MKYTHEYLRGVQDTDADVGQAPLRELLEAAGRVARFGTWQFDPATRALHWSDLLYDIHEIERATPIGLEEAIAMHTAEHAPLIARAIERAIAPPGESWDLQLQIRTARGRTIWVRSIGDAVRRDGAVVALRGIVQDIDEARTAADALRAERQRAEDAREQLRVALESLEDGFVLFDRDDRLALFNERYRSLYGASAELIHVGARFEDMIRGGVARGQYPAAHGREEQWIAARLAAHRSADSVIEQQLPDGRWLRIAERRTADGGTVGFRVDITELKRATERAQAAAREASRLGSEMNAIFELSPDGFVAFDASGHVTYSNSSFQALTGLAASVVDDLSLAEFDRELARLCDPAERYAASEEVADGPLVRLALRQPRPMTLERTVRSLRDVDGRRTGWVVYLRDVTEALAAERALLAQQAMFAAAFSHSADYISIVRLADHCFVDVNDAFERVTGFTRGEAIGHTALELGLWADPEQRSDVLREVREKGAVHEVASRMRRKDGALRQVVVSVALIDIGGEEGLMWTVRDVTEQLAAVEALQASEAKFAAAFRNAADHMVISRVDDGRIIEVNEAFCRTVGRPRDQVLGRTVLELGTWAEPARRAEALRLLRANGVLSNFPFRQRRGDGSIGHSLLSATLLTVDGAPCVLSTARDISERVAAEESARQLNQRLQATVAALEQLNRQNAALSEMRDLLQTCQTAAEVLKVAAHFVPRMLPGTLGALYLLNPGLTVLESVFDWGDDGLHEAVFEPDACWAIRRARAYRVEPGAHALKCEHVTGLPRGGYICLPLAAQGEHFGVLHVQYHGPPEEDPLQWEDRETFLRTMTEHIALAMSNARLREDLRHQASRDALTGLANRRYMEEAFEREISRCRRRGKPIAVLMLDIDHFKQFNDRYGHEAGDKVLREVAGVLSRSLRFEDLVCRYGGEEFLALLPEADERTALESAERVRRRVTELALHFRDAPLGGVTISIGVALFPEHGDAPALLIRRADEALYEAKRGGRDRVCLASKG